MKIAAIVMQKNETGILAQWLAYYALLCDGYENLFIFDDSSTDEKVVRLLHGASAKGSNITWNSDRKWNLESKGNLVSNLMQELHPRYDWFLPVDCDEFVC